MSLPSETRETCDLEPKDHPFSPSAPPEATSSAIPKRKSYMDLINDCDSFPYDEFSSNGPESHLSSMFQLKLHNDPRTHGFMRPEVVEKMPWTKSFIVNRLNATVTLVPPKPPTEAFTELIQAAINQNTFKILHGQHSEPYPIIGANYPVTIERYAANLFGIISRGAHLTVYTHTPSGMKIWVPRRSPNLFTYPNCLDTTVAGGVAATETPLSCIIREAEEEASLPSEIVGGNVKACGCLSYSKLNKTGDADGKGLFAPDIIYVFDLEVEENVVCRQNDEEVKEFTLMGVEEIKRGLEMGEFKRNSALVMIDFFVRHGIVTCENEVHYAEIVARMHRRLPLPTTSVLQ